MHIDFDLSDELIGLISATLELPLAEKKVALLSKILLLNWAVDNGKEKDIFECFGKMQYRKTLREFVEYLKNKNKLEFQKLQKILEENNANDKRKTILKFC